MANGNNMMKWPLVAAAVLIVVRVVLEQAGSPESINNAFGVVWLHFLVPFYFAGHIFKSGAARPYWELFRNLLLYTTYTRLMIIPTYWLAYWLQWTAPRFGSTMGGVVGDDITPIYGYLWIPLRNAGLWIVSAMVVGMILGGVTLMIRRRKNDA